MAPPPSNLLTQGEIANLIDYQIDCQGDECVSLYMPCYPSGVGQEEDLKRFNNLVGVAKSSLLSKAISKSHAEQILGPSNALRTNPLFWRGCGQGMACFWSRGLERVYCTPLAFRETVVVNRRFHLLPLLPLLKANGRFFILALTHDTAKLYEATKCTIREIRLPSAGEQSRKSPVEYFHQVEDAVTTALAGQQSPLVLACVGYLASIYGQVNNYPHLLRAKVPGSPNQWSVSELRDHAWSMAQPDFRRQEEAAWGLFPWALCQGLASFSSREIVLAATQGRVKSLFVKMEEEPWGVISTEQQTVQEVNSQLLDNSELDTGELDTKVLFEFAASLTLKSGGDFYAVESFPSLEETALPDSTMAAIFRC